MIMVISLLTTSEQKQVKKWDQSVSRAKIFLFIVRFKKLGFSAPLKLNINFNIFSLKILFSVKKSNYR